MNKILILSIGLLLFSCSHKSENIRPKEANIACQEFFVKGQFKEGVYTFCGIVPVETRYIYKNGSWKFWNIKGQLIAEGIYKSISTKIEGEGGCSYEVIEGVADKEKWNFWDENGKEIKPNEGLIKRLEICIDETRNT